MQLPLPELDGEPIAERSLHERLPGGFVLGQHAGAVEERQRDETLGPRQGAKAHQRQHAPDLAGGAPGLEEHGLESVRDREDARPSRGMTEMPVRMCLDKRIPRPARVRTGNLTHDVNLAFVFDIAC